MPFDANLLLIPGLSAINQNFAPSSTGAWGVLDIKGTGAKGLAAVQVAPRINVVYLASLEGYVEVAPNLLGTWERIATFPTLYQYMRKVPCVCTAVPVAADVGKYLYGASTTDDGKIIKFDPALYTVGGKGYVYVSMVDSGDTFDNAAESLVVSDAVGSGGEGTFTGTTTAISTVVEPGGIEVCRFATDRRYVRWNCTQTTSPSNFQRILIGLVPWPFKTL